MPTYRLYTISKDEHINARPRLIDCAGDAAALQKRAVFHDGQALDAGRRL